MHQRLQGSIAAQRMQPLKLKASSVARVNGAGSRQSRARMSVMAAAGSTVKPQLMVNSVTGKMGLSVAEAALRAGLDLVPYTLCAPEQASQKSINVQGVQVQLVPPAERDALMTELKKRYPNLMMVDYTIPDVIHEVADFYARHGTPFVMGTTGGDRARLMRQVQDAGLYAVIAPNMGKQIVALQAMFEYAANTFPGAFSGYTLRVVESHQSSKKDTSGTAKAIVSSLQQLGLKFGVDDIELVREPSEQVLRMKVPATSLNGHAYHTYQLLSNDGTVMFEFQHNVVGRTTYAEGTVDACLFLAQQVAAKTEKKIYNMVDVLQAGAMR